MASRFIRFTQEAVGTVRTKVGAYTVPAATTSILVATSFANILDVDITVTIEQGAGAIFTVLGPKAVTLRPGQAWTLADIGKCVLQAGDSLYVTANTAAAVDVVVGVMEMS